MEIKQDDGFTMKLAIVDIIPVVFFFVAVMEIFLKTGLWLVLAGGIICTLAGAGKVMWKVVLATRKKDVRFLFLQMRYLMPVGFLIIIFTMVFNRKADAIVSFAHNMVTFPALLFFALGIIGCVMMGVCAKVLDPDKSKSNWIEQGVNCLAQASFLVAIILAVR